jgi:hypothetical protein
MHDRTQSTGMDVYIITLALSLLHFSTRDGSWTANKTALDASNSTVTSKMVGITTSAVLKQQDRAKATCIHTCSVCETLQLAVNCGCDLTRVRVISGSCHMFDFVWCLHWPSTSTCLQEHRLALRCRQLCSDMQDTMVPFFILLVAWEAWTAFFTLGLLFTGFFMDLPAAGFASAPSRRASVLLDLLDAVPGFPAGWPVGITL